MPSPAAPDPGTSAPAAIHGAARPGQRVVGWKLDADARACLLARFAPRYDRAVADHITLRAGVAPDTPLPPAVHAEIIGRTDDRRGVEAMVVAIAGSTERPDGGTWHITWSLNPGRAARESNDAIAAHGWEPLSDPVPVALHPALFA